jgi:hypothetical protein
MLHHRSTFLGATAALNGIKTRGFLHHHAFKEVALQHAVDLLQAEVEREHRSAFITDRRRYQHGVFWKRIPFPNRQPLNLNERGEKIRLFFSFAVIPGVI